VGVVEEVGSTPSSFVVVASSAKLSLENDSFLSLDRLRERDDIWCEVLFLCWSPVGYFA
jgi:hypothetical protein